MKIAGDIMENDIRNKGNLIYTRDLMVNFKLTKSII